MDSPLNTMEAEQIAYMLGNEGLAVKSIRLPSGGFAICCGMQESGPCPSVALRARMDDIFMEIAHRPPHEDEVQFMQPIELARIH